jgi:two-component system OmpR family sensor kinase
MTCNTERTGFWAAVRAAPGRMSLRLKLVTALLVLVGLALAVTGLVGNAILKNYLLTPYDQSLAATETSQNLQAALRSYSLTGQPIQNVGVAVDIVANGKITQVVQPTTGVNGNSGPFAFRQSTPMPGPALETSPAWLVAHNGHPFTLPAQSGVGEWRVLLVSKDLVTNNGDTVSGSLAIAEDVTSVYRTTGQLASIDLIVGLVVLALLGLIGIVVIRSSLRPLKEIEATAGAIAAGDLTRRVPERDPTTEVGSLGRSLNAMLSQIETAFDAQSESEESARRSEARMRQFVADASHELRTPLTAIRGFAEYYRQRGGVESAAEAARAAAANGKLSPEDLDRIMRRVEQESARMGVLVEDMLMLARLDQQRPLDRNTVDLLTLAADAVHDARVVAPDRQIDLTVGSGAALLVKGDEVRLRQVIGNLMSNALSHTPAGTAIDVTLRAGMMAEIQGATATPTALGTVGVPVGPAAVLEVTDHGPGLSADQAQHAFERFYRADEARTTGGTGLGLAIVAALVAAHGGEVWVRTHPGDGATFAIALPLAPEAVQHPGQDDEPDEIDPDIYQAETDLADQPDEAGHADLAGGNGWVEFHSGRRAGGNLG